MAARAYLLVCRSVGGDRFEIRLVYGRQKRIDLFSDDLTLAEFLGHVVFQPVRELGLPLFPLRLDGIPCTTICVAWTLSTCESANAFKLEDRLIQASDELSAIVFQITCLCQP